MKRFMILAVILSLIVGTIVFGATTYSPSEFGPSIINWGPTSTIVQSIYKNIKLNFFDQKTDLYYAYSNNLYNKPAYLWSIAALFQAFDEMQKIPQLKNEEFLNDMLLTIDKYYDGVRSPLSVNYGGYDSYVVSLGGGTRYYDDNEWLGLALIDAYEITGNVVFLNKAEQVFDFVKSGQDNKLGGGIYWAEGGNSKNTCSNGPAVVLSLKLYEITHQASYLTFARQIYEWTNEHLLSPSGIYWDHEDLNGHVNKDMFTYNTGIMMQAMVLLYKVTGEEKYLKEAQKTAEASLKYFAPNGEFPFWDDGSFWFNAVLLRGYQNLYEVDHNGKYISAFASWSKEIWDKWGKVLEKQSLLYQAGMLEIYSRLYQINH